MRLPFAVSRGALPEDSVPLHLEEGKGSWRRRRSSHEVKAGRVSQWRRPFKIALGVLAAGAFASLAVFNLLLLYEFTPIYRQTFCAETAVDAGTAHFDVANVTMLLNLQMSCSNPNPYKIDILGSTPGMVYIGTGADPWQHRTQVGQMEIVPGSSLQEHGSGNVSVTVNVSAPERLLPEMLKDTTFAIMIELRFQSSLDVSFGFGSWAATTPIDQACGFNVTTSLGGGSTRFGKLACRPTFGDLIIPLVDEEPGGDHWIGFPGGEIAPEEVRNGTIAKNLSLGFIIIMSFVGAACFLFYAFWAAVGDCEEKMGQVALGMMEESWDGIEPADLVQSELLVACCAGPSRFSVR